MSRNYKFHVFKIVYLFGNTWNSHGFQSFSVGINQLSCSFHTPDGVYFISFAVADYIKRFTSKAIVKAIMDNQKESRKEFLLEQFLKAGIYNNPVKEGLVFRQEDYLYSSAADYSGEKGLLDDVIKIK